MQIFDRIFNGWIREPEKVTQWLLNFPLRPLSETVLHLLI